MRVFNYRGEDVTGKKVLLIDENFGEQDDEGNVVYEAYCKNVWPEAKRICFWEG